MILFSIIIPTYNRSAILPRAIQSVLNQTYSNWELILVDDGSTDDTQQKVATFNDPRIRYIFQENKGVCAARNFGAMIAKGDYLIFLDSDDQFELNLLAGLFTKSNFEKYDLVVGDLYVNNNSSSKLIIQKVDLQSFGIGKATVLTGTYVIKKSTYLSVGGYDENLKYAENSELLIKLLIKKKVSIKKIDTIFLFYTRSLDGGSRNNTNKIFAIDYIVRKHADVLHPYRKYRALIIRKKAYLNSFVNEKAALKDILNSIKIYPFFISSYYHLLKIFFKIIKKNKHVFI